MINKLYIRKSLQKNKTSYIHIVLIITLSIVVINIFSIYMDAVFNGDEPVFNGMTGKYETTVPTEQILLFNTLTVIFAIIGANKSVS